MNAIVILFNYAQEFFDYQTLEQQLQITVSMNLLIHPIRVQLTLNGRTR